MIEEERLKLPDQDPSRIFIGGFSQGCMVALAAFIKYQGTKPFGGFLGLSGMQALEIKDFGFSKEQL